MSDQSRDGRARTVDLAVGVTKAFRGWLVALVLVAAVVGGLAWGANLPSGPIFADETTTSVPGAAFEERQVAVGAECLFVQVADTPERRAQGLKHRDHIDPYDGMVFLFDSMGTRGFTMSEVRFPLTIGFYDDAGARVDVQNMEPCPADAGDCPAYTSRAPFRNALEVPQGRLPEGGLALECPA